jgi:uncharacterized membrane protein YjjB (DUF3815 family)
MNWIEFFEKGFWFGIAALGFAILFNVPQRVLFTVWLLAAAGGMTKLLLLHFHANVIVASLGGAVLIGMLTIPAAHNRHAPPLVFSIPAVIPMVPGVFAYRMMLGIIHLAVSPVNDQYQQIIAETINNGLNMFFILLSLAVGGSLPLLISRKESVKNLKIIAKQAKTRSSKTK